MKIDSPECSPAECFTLIERRLAGRADPALRRLGDEQPWFPKLDALPEDCARAFAAYDGRCAYCAADVGDALAIDYLVPHDRGGAIQCENLVAACEACKTARRGRHLDAFLARRIDLDARSVYARIARATARLRAAATCERSAS
jgi:5-methylcytosine-specific restriction endonuclease McrA